MRRDKAVTRILLILSVVHAAASAPAITRQRSLEETKDVTPALEKRAITDDESSHAFPQMDNNLPTTSGTVLSHDDPPPAPGDPQLHSDPSPEFGTPQLNIDQPPTSGTPQLHHDDLPPTPGAAPSQEDPLPASGTPQMHNGQPPTPGAPTSQGDMSSVSEGPQVHYDPSPWQQHNNLHPPGEMLQGESSVVPQLDDDPWCPVHHPDCQWRPSPWQQQHANLRPPGEMLQGESSVSPQFDDDPWSDMHHTDWRPPGEVLRGVAPPPFTQTMNAQMNTVYNHAVKVMIQFAHDRLASIGIDYWEDPSGSPESSSEALSEASYEPLTSSEASSEAPELQNDPPAAPGSPQVHDDPPPATGSPQPSYDSDESFNRWWYSSAPELQNDPPAAPGSSQVHDDPPPATGSPQPSYDSDESFNRWWYSSAPELQNDPPAAPGSSQVHDPPPAPGSPQPSYHSDGGSEEFDSPYRWHNDFFVTEWPYYPPSWYYGSEAPSSPHADSEAPMPIDSEVMPIDSDAPSESSSHSDSEAPMPVDSKVPSSSHSDPEALMPVDSEMPSLSHSDSEVPIPVDSEAPLLHSETPQPLESEAPPSAPETHTFFNDALKQKLTVVAGLGAVAGVSVGLAFGVNKLIKDHSHKAQPAGRGLANGNVVIVGERMYPLPLKRPVSRAIANLRYEDLRLLSILTRRALERLD